MPIDSKMKGIATIVGAMIVGAALMLTFLYGPQGIIMVIEEVIPIEPPLSQEEYLSEASRITVSSTQAVDGIIELLQEPRDERDTKWRTELSAYLTQIRQVYNDKQELNPPKELQQYHDKKLSAYRDFAKAADYLDSAFDPIDSLDLYPLEKAIRLLESGQRKNREAVLILEDWQNQKEE